MKAKTKLTRLWSVLLALVMVVGMLPTVALAAGAAMADFTSGDGSAALAMLNDAKTGTEDSTWNSSTNTLTLNGVNFVTTASTAVRLPDGSTIVLNGENTIKGGDAASGACYGIYAEGALTIQGTGTLNVTAGDAGGTGSNDRSCGIYTENALTMSSGIVTSAANSRASETKPFYSRVAGADIKTINFNSNGGSGKRMVAKISGETYILPENVFTPPAGKQFKCWSVDGTEKSVGDEITVSENITVTAVWKSDEYNVTVNPKFPPKLSYTFISIKCE